MPDATSTFEVSEMSASKDAWRIILFPDRIRFERVADGHSFEFIRSEFHGGVKVGGIGNICFISIVVEPHIGFHTNRATVREILAWAGYQPVLFVRLPMLYAIVMLLCGLVFPIVSILNIGQSSNTDRNIYGGSLLYAISAAMVAFALFSLSSLRPAFVLLHSIAGVAIGMFALFARSTANTDARRNSLLAVGIVMIAGAFIRFVKYRKFVVNCAAGVDPPAVSCNPFERKVNP